MLKKYPSLFLCLWQFPWKILLTTLNKWPFTYVFPRGMCFFTVAAHSRLTRREWKYSCVWLILTCGCFSEIHLPLFLFLFPTFWISQNLVSWGPLLAHSRALTWAEDCSSCLFLYSSHHSTAGVAIIVLLILFSSKTACNLYSHSLLPRGFKTINNHISYGHFHVIPFSEKQQSRRLLSLFLFTDHAALGPQ